VFILQWRDRNGTFDAQEARVVEVIRTPVQSVDAGQIWVPLERLRSMTGMPGEATIVTLAVDDGTTSLASSVSNSTWIFRNQSFLLRDIRILIQSKMVGSMFVYAILLFLALLAVFDTQVFSIFKRQKEIGTLIALGMTRGDVVRLFTLEGTLSGLLAAVLAALYGVPLLAWFERTGWRLPETTDSYGFAIGDVLYPVFSADVVLGTGLVILVLTAVVSFLPARRIARVEPTLALRGKVF
jgi:ABC-type lipoprotein release transport system permease subunit